MGKKVSARSTKRRPGRPRIEQLTEPQRRALQAIRDYRLARGYPPTIKELASQLGITGPSAYDQVNQLIRKGYLKREAHKARGLVVLREPEQGISHVVSVPILGTVAAGKPIFTLSNFVGEVFVEGHLVRGGRCFALKVSGDSMVEAGIGSGDMVIVRQQPIAENGDTVVALVDGDATIKRLSIEDQQIELRPANKKYRAIPIGPDTNLQILGKVVAHRRRQK